MDSLDITCEHLVVQCDDDIELLICIVVSWIHSIGLSYSGPDTSMDLLGLLMTFIFPFGLSPYR